MVTYPWSRPTYEFEHEDTYYKCPECGQTLTNPVPSAMLVCSDSHGPYFLV